MSSSEQTRPLSLHQPQRASEAFAEYRDVEKEQRRNTSEDFDEALFDEAADLVIRKLEQLEEEGLA